MNPVLVLFALSTIVLAALWLEARVVAFKKLGAAATAILTALVLSNVGLLPGTSPVYDFLMGRAVIAGVIPGAAQRQPVVAARCWPHDAAGVCHRRRPDLILPGVAVGMLGNALGNYAGIAIAYVSKSLIG